MKASVASILLTFVVVPAVQALECKCPAPANLEQSFAEEFERAAAVFRGVSSARTRVPFDPVCLDFQRLSDAERLKCLVKNRIEFQVSSVWKGDIPARTYVRTARRGACGTGLEQGQEYIVFAYPIPNHNALYMQLCSTRRLGSSVVDDLVAFLKRRTSAPPVRSEQ
jgi:hypothetical protein